MFKLFGADKKEAPKEDPQKKAAMTQAQAQQTIDNLQGQLEKTNTRIRVIEGQVKKLKAEAIQKK